MRLKGSPPDGRPAMSYVGNPTGSMIGSSEPPTGRIISSPSAPGTPGKSAYQLAVEAGFEGTLEEWLDSLEGTDGASTWNDISGKPSTFPPDTHTHSMAQVTGLEAKLNSKPDTASLADVALSGSYNDLTDTPSSSGPVDWDDIENRPEIPTELTDLDTEVTGEELDALKDTVESLVLSGGNIQSDWNASSGPSAILNKPVLATVATTGSYGDLANKPVLGTAASQDSSAFATAIQGIVATNLAVTLTPLEDELGYLAGVTSPIQEQFDGLADVASSGSYDDLDDKPVIPPDRPSQTGNNGKFLKTNGTSLSWGEPSGGGGGMSFNPVLAVADHTAQPGEVVFVLADSSTIDLSSSASHGDRIEVVVSALNVTIEWFDLVTQSTDNLTSDLTRRIFYYGEDVDLGSGPISGWVQAL